MKAYSLHSSVEVESNQLLCPPSLRSKEPFTRSPGLISHPSDPLNKGLTYVHKEGLFGTLCRLSLPLDVIALYCSKTRQ